MTENEVVILLHGLGRTRFSLRKLEKALQRSGYRTCNVGYPSTRRAVEELADAFVAPAVAACLSRGAERVHFVTHSLGGILVRQFLTRGDLPPGSRIVMLAPPNRGSELAEWLRNFLPYRWILGPAGQQLGTGADSLPRRLPPGRTSIGIIAGDAGGLTPLTDRLFRGDHDGKVAVARAGLEGMGDFLVVKCGHTWIMNDATAIAQTIHFLRHGRFRH